MPSQLGLQSHTSQLIATHLLISSPAYLLIQFWIVVFEILVYPPAATSLVARQIAALTPAADRCFENVISISQLIWYSVVHSLSRFEVAIRTLAKSLTISIS